MAKVDDGVFSLTGEQVALLEEVDARVTRWAATRGAGAELHGEMLRRSDLDRIGFFDSFPHLAHRVEPEIEADRGAGEDHILTTAACYAAYFARVGQSVAPQTLLTVRATCRRRERGYAHLRRQREFRMREVVAIGTPDHVREHLETGKTFVEELAASYGITGQFEVATDPFFRKDDPRIVYQRVFPTKREFVDSSGLAIASLNFHQTFFGDSCRMTLAGSEPETASTACVAFGLDRWVDAVGRATKAPPG